MHIEIFYMLISMQINSSKQTSLPIFFSHPAIETSARFLSFLQVV
jgi:hypothetical protein